MFPKPVYYCPKCEKKAFYPEFITKSSLEKERKCPRCSGKIIKYWEDQGNAYMILNIAAPQLFLIGVVYSLWKHYLGSHTSLDLAIVITNVLLSGFILIGSSPLRKHREPPKESEAMLEKYPAYKKQYLYVLLFTFVGYIAAIVLDLIIWGLWKLFS
ncbi:MAG: hypothetical protein ACTSYD_12030 [Candidatus Heimdallarchaeaceae archaeon]